MYNFVGRPLLLWQRHFGKFGLFFEKIAHESSCMPHRPDTFEPTSRDDQRGRPLLPRQRHLRQARSLIAYRLVAPFVCLSVCNALQIDSSSLFIDGIEPFLGHQFSWQKLQNDALRILNCCHGNEIWAIFAQISNCFFFFVFRWNRAIFGRLVLHDPLYKTLFLVFDLGPLTPKIYSPKFDQKSPITRLVLQIDRRCLRILWGFRGWPIQSNHVQCCGADPCYYGNEIWAKIAYNSTCTADRPQIFRPSTGFSGMADSMQPCKILYDRPLLPWQQHFR